MYQLDITRPGSLEPGIHTTITPAQRSSVEALLNTDVTYGELLAFLVARANEVGRHYLDGDGETWIVGEYGNDAPVGAGESVEASRG